MQILKQFFYEIKAWFFLFYTWFANFQQEIQNLDFKNRSVKSSDILESLLR